MIDAPVPAAQVLLERILEEERKQTNYLKKIQRTVSMFGWLLIIGTLLSCVLFALSQLSTGY